MNIKLSLPKAAEEEQPLDDKITLHDDDNQFEDNIVNIQYWKVWKYWI